MNGRIRTYALAAAAAVSIAVGTLATDAEAGRKPRPPVTPPSPPPTVGIANWFTPSDATLMIDFPTASVTELVDSTGRATSVSRSQIREVRWVSTNGTGVVRVADDFDGDGVSDPTTNPVTGAAYYHINDMPGCGNPQGGIYTGRVDSVLNDGRVLQPASTWFAFEPVYKLSSGYQIWSCFPGYGA